MTIYVQCECGARLKARDEFAGRRAECPSCGRTIQVAKAAAPSGGGGQRLAGSLPTEIREFLDPPASKKVRRGEKRRVFRRMLEGMLDPRSIQWMLMLGGGLSVLGLIVWLVSLGVFEDPIVLAVAMGVGTLAILGGGWYLVLKTKYRIAGQALTFLGCVVAPLNLWFYHVQELVMLDENLWLGGLACCLIYAATVYVLRDPLFMYAVEGGVTLTVLLFLPSLDLVTGPTFLRWDVSLFLMALGLVSIHAERAFPADGDLFTRRRFGLPLFWSGHAQVGAALVILLGTQIYRWLQATTFDEEWIGNLLADNPLADRALLAGGLWLLGTYVYLYSDIVVRRVGGYTYLAAFSLLLAILTLVGSTLETEGVILVLALTALGANLLQSFMARGSERLARVMTPLGIILSALPLLMGLVLHIRATSSLMPEPVSDTQPWLFVIAMLVLALATRASAFVHRRAALGVSAVYFFFSAGAVIVAAAGLLRLLGLTEWTQQAPLLMVIPVAYIIGSRVWRGRGPERPLGWIAHAATLLILAHALIGALGMVESVIRPVTEQPENLLLGLVFAEAAVFYVLAGLFRRRGVNIFFAVVAACGALWQFLGYWGVPGPYYTMLYCVLAIVFLVAGRMLIEEATVYRRDGSQRRATRGRGVAAFQGGNALLVVALLAAILQVLGRLASAGKTEWSELLALVMTTVASIVAIWLVPSGGWRRLYTTTSVVLAGLVFLTLNVLIELSGWQKLEIFCVVIGLAMLVSSHIAVFRETEKAPGDMVSFGLFLGSVLAAGPLLVAVIYHHYFVADDAPTATVDDLVILGVTIVMVLTGFSWQIKSTVLFGGGSLALYLIMVVGSIVYQPQVAIGVYLAIGGAIVFAGGIVLSIYREKLLELPERIAKREGIFRVMSWR